MDLTHQELNAIKRQNQRLKALGNGQVTTLWKDGKIEKIIVNAEVAGNIYAESEERIELKG